MVLAAVVAGAVAVLSLPAITTAAKAKPAAKVANDGRAKCYECHDEIKALKEAYRLLLRSGLPRVVLYGFVVAYAIGFIAYFPFRQVPT